MLCPHARGLLLAADESDRVQALPQRACARASSCRARARRRCVRRRARGSGEEQQGRVFLSRGEEVEGDADLRPAPPAPATWLAAAPCIDYLQAIQPDEPRHNRTQEVAEIMAKLKKTAGDIGMALVIFSQYAREEYKDGAEPRSTRSVRRRHRERV